MLNAWRFKNGATGNGENYTPNPDRRHRQPARRLHLLQRRRGGLVHDGDAAELPGANTGTTSDKPLPGPAHGRGDGHGLPLLPGQHQRQRLGRPETSLPNPAVRPPVRCAPYLPGQSGQWFNNTFAYDQTGKPNMPLRPILVARNPVSNFVTTTSSTAALLQRHAVQFRRPRPVQGLHGPRQPAPRLRLHPEHRPMPSPPPATPRPPAPPTGRPCPGPTTPRRSTPTPPPSVNCGPLTGA